MTLILVTEDDRGDLTVIADTFFGESGRTGSEVGPKIFLVPVAISDLEDEVRIPLPSMGFAFAGNVISGQFTHALASTCLQNLAGWVADGRPDVEDVASFYATCAVRIYEERRRHFAGDGYGFDGIVFGFSERRGHPAVFHFTASVGHDGSCVAPISQVELEEGIPFAVGSGAQAARLKIDSLRSRSIDINPFALMDSIISDDAVPSVGGEIQAATADGSGVELRPVMMFGTNAEGDLRAGYSVMSINMHRLGMVAGYVPVGTPVLAQSPGDVAFVMGKRE